MAGRSSVEKVEVTKKKTTSRKGGKRKFQGGTGGEDDPEGKKSHRGTKVLHHGSEPPKTQPESFPRGGFEKEKGGVKEKSIYY